MSGRQSAGVERAVAQFKKLVANKKRKPGDVYRLAVIHDCDPSSLYKALRALGYEFRA